MTGPSFDDYLARQVDEHMEGDDEDERESNEPEYDPSDDDGSDYDLMRYCP